MWGPLAAGVFFEADDADVLEFCELFVDVGSLDVEQPPPRRTSMLREVRRVRKGERDFFIL